MPTVLTFDSNPHNLLEIHRALRQIGILLPPSTYDQIDAPDANDDITQGWRVGSKWIDVVADRVYHCADNTEGAAVWNNMAVVPEVAPFDENFVIYPGPASADLTNERILAAGDGISLTDGGAGGNVTVANTAIKEGYVSLLTLDAANEITFKE
jgi:hypothetical protein